MGIWPIPVFGLFDSVATDNMDPGVCRTKLKTHCWTSDIDYNIKKATWIMYKLEGCQHVRKFKWCQPDFPNSTWERKHQLPKMLIIRQLHVSEKPECKTVACTWNAYFWYFYRAVQFKVGISMSPKRSKVYKHDKSFMHYKSKTVTRFGICSLRETQYEEHIVELQPFHLISKTTEFLNKLKPWVMKTRAAYWKKCTLHIKRTHTVNVHQRNLIMDINNFRFSEATGGHRRATEK